MARLRSEQGLGLIELLIAMVVLSVGLLAIVASFSSGTVAMTRASRIATAGVLADTQMETYRALSYDWIGLDTAASTDSTYTADAACIGGGGCQNITPTNGASCASGGNVKTNFPDACAASRTATGPDSHAYRIDTYVRELAATTGALPQRARKDVTVVVREGATPYKLLAREESVFDCSTGADGSTCPS